MTSDVLIQGTFRSEDEDEYQYEDTAAKWLRMIRRLRDSAREGMGAIIFP